MFERPTPTAPGSKNFTSSNASGTCAGDQFPAVDQLFAPAPGPLQTKVAGAWLETVNVKESLATKPPGSDAVMVITAAPLKLAVGVTVTVRLVPLPAKTILALGTRPGLEEAPATTRESTEPGELKVNGIGPVEAFTATVKFVISKIVGAAPGK